MQRHLPQKPEPRYWVTGNYIFDYRDSKYGVGAMLQAFLIGDNKADLPVMAYFKFDTEALGNFTGQFAVVFPFWFFFAIIFYISFLLALYKSQRLA